MITPRTTSRRLHGGSRTVHAVSDDSVFAPTEIKPQFRRTAVLLRFAVLLGVDALVTYRLFVCYFIWTYFRGHERGPEPAWSGARLADA